MDISGFDELAKASAPNEDLNCQWRIARHPTGNVCAKDFKFETRRIKDPASGEVLLKTHYLGLAPVMRMYMMGGSPSGEASLGINDVIHGRGVAQIIKSRNPQWREGEIVQGQIGWQTYKVSAMTAQEKFFRMPPNGLPAVLGAGVLGMTGLSAYAGLFPTGNPKKGDRMVLSGAAGGVGSMVSQIAASVVGCDVVGIAGGAKKCAFVLDHGCRAAIDYKSEDLRSKLDELCPEGIDVYFDNVGGETLRECLERLRMNSRVVLCGSISEYARDIPFSLPNYTRLRRTDSRMQGFFVYNHIHRWDEVMRDLATWIREGKLKPVQDVILGFENMPKALAQLYSGHNVGIQCCNVRGEPEVWV